MSNGASNSSFAVPDRDRSAEIRFIAQTIERESDRLIQRITREQLLAVLSRQGSFARTAEEVIPVSHEISSEVSSRIISRTARLLLTTEEYKLAVQNSFSMGQKRRPEGTFPFCNPEFRREIAEACGEKLWENQDEVGLLIELVNDSAFYHAHGTHPGEPDYERIASLLNDIFWEGETYREADKCWMKMHQIRAARGEVINANFRRWSVDERVMLMRLVADPEFKHRGGSKKGMCDMDRIILHLNAVFWDGQNIRNKIKCWGQVRYIRKSEVLRLQIEAASGFTIQPFDDPQ